MQQVCDQLSKQSCIFLHVAHAECFHADEYAAAAAAAGTYGTGAAAAAAAAGSVLAAAAAAPAPAPAAGAWASTAYGQPLLDEYIMNIGYGNVVMQLQSPAGLLGSVVVFLAAACGPDGNGSLAIMDSCYHHVYAVPVLLRDGQPATICMCDCPEMQRAWEKYVQGADLTAVSRAGAKRIPFWEWAESREQGIMALHLLMCLSKVLFNTGAVSLLLAQQQKRTDRSSHTLPQMC